jgi:hypothetical protein
VPLHSSQIASQPSACKEIPHILDREFPDT